MEKKTRNIILVTVLIILISIPSCFFIVKYSIPDRSWFYDEDKSWLNDANANIERIRKGNFTIRILHNGLPVPDLTVTLNQTEHEYWFGAATPSLLWNDKFEDEYSTEITAIKGRMDEMYNILVPENCFKWRQTEATQNEYTFEDYYQCANWTQSHNKTLRHHAIFWSREQNNPDWLSSLTDEDLRSALFSRIESVQEAAGNDIHYLDVCNEMCYHSFYRDRLGDSIIKDIFDAVRIAFPNATLYLNEFLGGDSTGQTYVDFALNLIAQGVEFDRIGLQAHIMEESHRELGLGVSIINDTLNKIGSALQKPIFITEYDFYTKSNEFRADYMEEFYTVCFGNQYTEGIINWAWVDGKGMLPHRGLVKTNGDLLPAGERFYDLVFNRWWTSASDITSVTGEISLRAFYGNYHVSIQTTSGLQSFNIELRKDSPAVIIIEI